MKFPDKYEELQLKLCSNSRQEGKKGDKPARMGQRLIRNTLESWPYFEKYSLVDADDPAGISYGILDIGCGDGWGLECFKNLGVKKDNLYGIEYVQERVDTARSYGFNVAKGSAEESSTISTVGWGVTRFNIFCSHTLEHAVDQKKAIEEMQEIGNLIYLIVPIEFKIKSGNGAHFSPIKNLEQLKQYFDHKVWEKVKEEYRFNLEYEGVLVYVRRKE